MNAETIITHVENIQKDLDRLKAEAEKVREEAIALPMEGNTPVEVDLINAHINYLQHVVKCLTQTRGSSLRVWNDAVEAFYK